MFEIPNMLHLIDPELFMATMRPESDPNQVRDRLDNHVIEDFLVSYERIEYKAYEGLAKHGKEMLSEELRERDIKYEIYNRGTESFASGNAKDPESVRRTIVRRQKQRTQEYKSFEEIEDDMHDLAGLRIALYYPNDFKKVEELIENRFPKTKPPQDWPDPHLGPHRYQALDSDRSDVSGKRSRFPGYFARHYRVHLKPEDIKEPAMEGKTLEIQLMSLLMHAWSKMHHELVYKPQPGRPLVDEDDERLIDISSGIIIAGEQVVRQIQINIDKKQERRRLPFNNLYDLWGYIDTKWITGPEGRLPQHGRNWIQSLAEERHDIRQLLFTSLTDLKMGNPEDVDDLVQKTVQSYGQNISLTNDSGVTLVRLLYVMLANSPQIIRRVTTQLNLPLRACRITESDRHKEEVKTLSEMLRLIRYYVFLICNALRWFDQIATSISQSAFLERLRSFNCSYPSGDDFLKSLHPASPLERTSGTPSDLNRFCEYLLEWDNIQWKISVALSTLTCSLVLVHPRRHAYLLSLSPEPTHITEYNYGDYTICSTEFIENLNLANSKKLSVNLTPFMYSDEIHASRTRRQAYKSITPYLVASQTWNGKAELSWTPSIERQTCSQWMSFEKLVKYLDSPNMVL
jgi:ppGpp synthetase/RelA/SpoT-type nucleotidyltranferase